MPPDNHLERSNSSEGDDVDAIELSHVGEAALNVLQKEHGHHQYSLWNVTSGSRVVGELHQTPRLAFKDDAANLVDPKEGHDDWFPDAMADILKRTNVWCDVLCCTPPDGLFLTKFNEALKTLAHRAITEDKPITIRMIFGNLIGFPVNLKAALRDLTKGIDDATTKNSSHHRHHLRLWVGTWRSHVSFNHSKIIVVDGRFLHTGGHNLLTDHYLKHNPAHDVSVVMEGNVAHDAHLYANKQWDFIEAQLRQERSEKLHTCLPLTPMNYVAIRRFPPAPCNNELPPRYHKGLVPTFVLSERDNDSVPVITMGHCGAMVKTGRPSDDAFVAVLDSAKTNIRMALQDLGPWTVPGTKIKMPMSTWPHSYLVSLGRAIWERQVVVDIVLSNPASTPGRLMPFTLANTYGHGWSCVECAIEIVKTIRKQYPNDATNEALRGRIASNLRICYLRQNHGNKWEDGNTMALHSKHWIIDDVATYIGSQNMYVCHAADWGVMIDSPEQTQAIMKEYWNPMWKASYKAEDCSVHEVMDGLGKKKFKFLCCLFCCRQ